MATLLAKEDDSNSGQIISTARLPPYQDPTALTNELVDKAVRALREILEAKIEGNSERISQSEATITRHVDLAVNTLKELLSNEVTSLHGLIGTFKTTVNERFALGDAATAKAASDVKSAVDTAFAVAKEAVGEQNKSNALSISKSEAATIKTIDQLTENLRLSVKNTHDKIEAMRKTTDDKMTDLKDRLVAMEARTQVSDPSTSMALRDMATSIGTLRQGADAGTGHSKGMGDSWGIIAMAISLLVGISVIIGAIVHLSK